MVLLVGWPTLPPSLSSNLRCRRRRTHLCPPSSLNRVFFSSSLDADISSASLSIHCMPPPWPIQVSAPVLALMSSMSLTSGPLGQMVLLWHAPIVHAAVVCLTALSLFLLSIEVGTTTSVLWVEACPALPDLCPVEHLPGPAWPLSFSMRLRCLISSATSSVPTQMCLILE
jgi:hypothetical protein